jgi:hypothetical protein
MLGRQNTLGPFQKNVAIPTVSNNDSCRNPFCQQGALKRLDRKIEPNTRNRMPGRERE